MSTFTPVPYCSVCMLKKMWKIMYGSLIVGQLKLCIYFLFTVILHNLAIYYFILNNV